MGVAGLFAFGFSFFMSIDLLKIDWRNGKKKEVLDLNLEMVGLAERFLIFNMEFDLANCEKMDLPDQKEVIGKGLLWNNR